MRPIPTKLRKQLAADPFMRCCVYTQSTQDVSWEHCWLYGNRQINERWAIVPLKRDLNVNMSADVKEYCRWVSINRATDEELKKYPRTNWQQLKSYLNKKYEKRIR